MLPVAYRPTCRGERLLCFIPYVRSLCTGVLWKSIYTNRWTPCCPLSDHSLPTLSLRTEQNAIQPRNLHCRQKQSWKWGCSGRDDSGKPSDLRAVIDRSQWAVMSEWNVSIHIYGVRNFSLVKSPGHRWSRGCSVCVLQHVLEKQLLSELRMTLYRWILCWLAFSFPSPFFSALSLALTHRCMCRCTLVYVCFFSPHAAALRLPHSLLSFISECINPDERCVGEHVPLCSDPLICCTWLP